MSFPAPTRAAELSDLEPFAVEVQRRDQITIVRPCGELDMATIETLRTTLDVAIAETPRAALEGARLVLDLRRLSFIDSTGLHLAVALDERARRDGFLLTLIAPAAPIDRAIQLCGLDQVLPFAPADDAVDGSFRTEPWLSLQSDLGEPAVMTHRLPGLTVDRAHIARAPGVLLRGAMDLDTASQLTATLDAAIRESRGAFVIDLCDVTFLDSSGVSLLVHARAVLGREERALLIICPPGPARRIFELAGIDDLLELFETRDQAAALLQPAA